MTIDAISFSGLRLPWLTDWVSLCGREAPTVMEIGFGGGHFLVDVAARSPDINVLGVERSFYSLTETERRVFKAGLRNVRLIYADARLTLAYVCQPESLDGIYVNFPDPFPKKGHAKRRLLTPETLALIASRMQPNGLLTIATDVVAYAN